MDWPSSPNGPGLGNDLIEIDQTHCGAASPLAQLVGPVDDWSRRTEDPFVHVKRTNKRAASTDGTTLFVPMKRGSLRQVGVPHRPGAPVPVAFDADEIALLQEVRERRR